MRPLNLRDERRRLIPFRHSQIQIWQERYLRPVSMTKQLSNTNKPLRLTRTLFLLSPVSQGPMRQRGCMRKPLSHVRRLSRWITLRRDEDNLHNWECWTRGLEIET